MKASGVFLRGLAMGAADIVPGVSGGTVAFITGIYPRLLHSLSRFDLTALKLVFTGRIAAAWEHVNGSFLALLAAGILTSIVSLAQVLGWLLEHYPEPLWALFFGLILASAIMLFRHLPRVGPREALVLALGTVMALLVAVAPNAAFVEGNLGVFLAGFIAICAMILPGVSGSFILVLLGMYASVLGAIRSLDLLFLLIFALGAGSGLLCFSRLLDWLLTRYRDTTIALLTGFLFGSLAVVWPWKRTLSWIEASDGGQKPVQQLPVLPWDYAAHTGAEPLLLLCLCLAVAGFAAVMFVDHRWGQLQVDAR